MYRIEYFDQNGKQTAAHTVALPLLTAINAAETRMQEFTATSARIVHLGDGKEVWSRPKDS
jgi:hypothetical protein